MSLIKNKDKPIPYILIFFGVLSILFSILFVASIPAFIGLGLIFWGLILLFICDNEYVKKNIVESIFNSQINLINQLYSEFKLKGNPIYLPPKYFKNLETQKMFISKEISPILPTIEEINICDDKLFIENPTGLLITPMGLELTSLFEKKIKIDFNKVNEFYLQSNLPKIFEDLELASKFEMKIEKDEISVKMESNLFFTNERPGSSFFQQGPLESSIACALVKAMGKPLIISQNNNSDKKSKKIFIFQILREGENNN